MHSLVVRNELVVLPLHAPCFRVRVFADGALVHDSTAPSRCRALETLRGCLCALRAARPKAPAPPPSPPRRPRRVDCRLLLHDAL
jgi:hypothetical protein